ncbi:hypothetical protein D3C84_1009170 [compost metagenome]
MLNRRLRRRIYAHFHRLVTNFLAAAQAENAFKLTLHGLSQLQLAQLLAIADIVAPEQACFQRLLRLWLVRQCFFE